MTTTGSAPLDMAREKGRKVPRLADIVLLCCVLFGTNVVGMYGLHLTTGMKRDLWIHWKISLSHEYGHTLNTFVIKANEQRYSLTISNIKSNVPNSDIVFPFHPDQRATFTLQGTSTSFTTSTIDDSKASFPAVFTFPSVLATVS